MPPPRLVSRSIRTPWVWSPEVRAGLAVFVGRDVTGPPIGGLRRAPVRAMPCPSALLAKTARLTMSSHGDLTPNYYGKFPLPPARAGATHTLTFALFTDSGKRVSVSAREMGTLILKQEL